MAAKGTRNTAISFGGYEVTVALKKAERSRDIKTVYVNEAGEKVTMSGAAAGTGSRRAAPGVRKAVDLGGSQYRELPEGELDAIAERSREKYDRMVVLETIPAEQMPWQRVTGSYWLQPAGGSIKALRLLADALGGTRRVAIVKWLGQSREKLGAIAVYRQEAGMALLLTELTFANDFAGPDDDALSINHADVTESEREAAAKLIDAFARMPGIPSVIETASDEAVDARLELVEDLVSADVEAALEMSLQNTTAAEAA